MGAFFNDVLGDLADTGRLAGMLAMKLVEAIEELREPHHQAVIADVKGEVDDDGDDGEAEDRRDEQQTAVLDYVAEHQLVLVLLRGARLHRLVSREVVEYQFFYLRGRFFIGK